MKPIDLIETPRDHARPPRYTRPTIIRSRQESERGFDDLMAACHYPVGIRAEDGRLLYPEWT